MQYMLPVVNSDAVHIVVSELMDLLL